jgi:hypothetical protein
MKVYLAQLKCPANHAVMAVCGEYENLKAAQALEPMLMESFNSVIEEGVLNRECGLCHATKLHVEIGATYWKSMDDAMPHLLAEQAKQILMLELMKRSRN